MSLAWRILLAALLTNLLVVSGVQAVLFAVQQEWFRMAQSEKLAASRLPFLVDVFRVDRPAAEQVRRILRSPVGRLEDAIVTSENRPPVYGLVAINPRGAVHRDPDIFLARTIMDGFLRAHETDALVPCGNGYAVAVRVGNRAVGNLWFVLKLSLDDMPSLPLWFSVGAVLLSSLLFGTLIYWLVVRTVGRPLARVSAAAAQVGMGAYGVRLPVLHGVRELDTMVASFNAMATKVQSHTGELQRAITAAVEDVKQKERALVISSRLASVGTLAAGIAHEINNPIGGMQNAVHRLLQEPELSERQRSYLQLVLDGLQRIGRTTRKILDFSPRAAVARPFLLGSAVEGARALLEHRLQSQGVRFTSTVSAELAVVGDVHEIQQVLLNVFLNSLDALQQKGAGGNITVTAAAEPGRVQLLAEDNGPGMDAKDLPRVMDPFFTMQKRPDASGLGMFISYSIVRNHGGDLTLDSALGQGFRVRLTLPMAP
ncbi:MAG: HAMP domain-containing histidine kinase [Planctomycetes bacterium]|nr:HAMP domain-containing histidine kinase [Planctomycetota bacterium]